jgi:alkanesulfonate monooxygenase SsuD/methylene tetrahydromethanopterin reductase-like flavin-dependent oxidoreductase (luciferase family)
VKIAIKTPLHHSNWADLVAAWRAAEARDVVSGIYVFDHLSPVFGTRGGSCLEAWTALSVLASVTDRVEVGTLASPAFLRPRWLQIQQAVSVQALSSGRLVMGLGIGWAHSAWRDARVPKLSRAQRIAALEALVRSVTELDNSLRHDNGLVGESWCATLGEFGRPMVTIGGASKAVRLLAYEYGDRLDLPAVSPDDARQIVVDDARSNHRDIPTSISWTMESDDFGDVSMKLDAYSESGVAGMTIALPPPYSADRVARRLDCIERWALR